MHSASAVVHGAAGLDPLSPLRPFLGWLTASLFAYVATAFMVNVPWGDALTAIVAPRFSADPDNLLAMVAVFARRSAPISSSGRRPTRSS
jgi:hypothetical protein